MRRLQLKCDGTRWRREGKWRGNWGMERVASTLHTTSEHGVSSISAADAHTSAASSRLNWRPCRFKWTSPFRQKTKSDFCACAITFQLASTLPHLFQSNVIWGLHSSGTFGCLPTFRFSLLVVSAEVKQSKTGQTGCPETSVNNYQHTLRNNPEERRPHLHDGGNLKSRIT